MTEGDNKRNNNNDTTMSDRANKKDNDDDTAMSDRDNKKDNDNDKNKNRETSPVPPIPPPTPPQPTKDPSSLLSPWWSERPTSPEQERKKEENGHLLIHFTRTASLRENDKMLFNEHCCMLTKKETQQKLQQLSSSSNNNIRSSPSSDCRMICLLRENEERRRQRQDKLKAPWNPLCGSWLVVATTEARCLEHINEKDITKKDHPDYYTIELGERLMGSKDDLKRIFTRAMYPVQELTRRSIETWKDGTQAALLARFWESAKRGDAFVLVRDNTKRLVQAIMGSDKKSSGGNGDEKNNPNK